MARQKPSDQLATLEKQRKELDDKLKEARAKAEAEAKEKHRRKAELVGLIALKELEANPSGEFASALRDLLHTGVTRAADRAEFSLKPLPKKVMAAVGGTSVSGG
jgi:hypothetical protein